MSPLSVNDSDTKLSTSGALHRHKPTVNSGFTASTTSQDVSTSGGTAVTINTATVGMEKLWDWDNKTSVLGSAKFTYSSTTAISTFTPSHTKDTPKGNGAAQRAFLPPTIHATEVQCG